jgi:hypothetical protein
MCILGLMFDVWWMCTFGYLNFSRELSCAREIFEAKRTKSTAPTTQTASLIICTADLRSTEGGLAQLVERVLSKPNCHRMHEVSGSIPEFSNHFA